jgi:hypothetical protein
MRAVVAAVTVVLGLTVATSGAQRWVEQVTIDGDPVLRGLPKDAIPAIDRPTFVPAASATFMRDEEPVIGVVAGREARAYPTWLLNAHEVVNDRIGGRAIAVTW